MGRAFADEEETKLLSMQKDIDKTGYVKKDLDDDLDDKYTNNSQLWGVLRSLNPVFETVKLEECNARKSRLGPRHRAGYLIGRHSECDIVLKSPHISNRHCLIFKESCWHHELKCMKNLIFLEDFSSNGTYVNGVRVKRGVQTLLYHGDEIQLIRKNGRKDMEHIDDRFCILQIPEKAGRYKPGTFSKTGPSSTTESIHDKYVLKETLGSGNFGTVRMALCRTTHENYAVKIISKERLCLQPKFLNNLRQEITLLMSLSHPNIIQIHDVYDELGYVYLVLEYMDGGELFDSIVLETHYSEETTRFVMKQILEALKYLHDRNISHRDLKPENILMCSKSPGDYRIKISDFGLARLVDSKTFMGTLCGTPSYVAPEVLASDKERKYTKAIDLWSAGIVMYICLCGFPPFSEENAPPPMIEQILKGDLSFPSPRWDKISSSAIDLVKNLLVVDATKRITASESLKHPWIANTKYEPQKDKEVGSKSYQKSKITDELSRERRLQISNIHKIPAKKTEMVNLRPKVGSGPENIREPRKKRSAPPILMRSNTPPISIIRKSPVVKKTKKKSSPLAPKINTGVTKRKSDEMQRSKQMLQKERGIIEVRKAFLKETLRRYGITE